jgi:hypothetical protein
MSCGHLLVEILPDQGVLERLSKLGEPVRVKMPSGKIQWAEVTEPVEITSDCRQFTKGRIRLIRKDYHD